MGRISRHELYMGIAHLASKRATCHRLNVGAVVVDSHNGNVVSIGYNGVPAGMDHCQGASCPGASGCTLTIHAEHNAILRIPARVGGPLHLYVTDSPCQHCYDLICNDGRFSRLFFERPYRITDHITPNLFEPHLEVYRLLPAGYLIDWFSGIVVTP